MNQGVLVKDLVVLVADKQFESAVEGLLGRHQSLKIRAIAADIYRHPEKDPGCLRKSTQFLSLFVNQYEHALVLFDREGSGKEAHSREALETEVEQQLHRSGWKGRAAAVVVDPELENWVWSDSPQVDAALGWVGRNPDLRSWLAVQGFLRAAESKPEPPKEALEQALRLVKKPRSASIYAALSRSVSLRRCVDPAFKKFAETLQAWFPKI